MAYNETLLTVTAFVSAAVSGTTALAAVSRSRGSSRVAGDALAGVALVAALWAVSFGFRVSAGGVGTALTWFRVGLVVSTALPTLALVFALFQTGNGGVLSQWTAAALAVEPTAAASLAATNHLHGLYVVGTETVALGEGVVLVPLPGTALLVHSVYSLVVGLGATLLFAVEAVATEGPYRRQATLLCVAVAIPICTTGATLAEVPFAPPYNTTPVWLGLSSLLLVVAIRAYGLFDVSPVAHETIIAEIDDAVVIVDGRGRVVDSNPAATAAFGVDESDVGRAAAEVLPNAAAVDRLLAGEETTLSTADDRHYEATVTSLSVGNRAGDSRVLVFRDVTDRQRVERRFRTYVEQSNDALMILDDETTVEYVSAAAERVFGRPPDSIEGQTVFSLVHPDDQSDIHRVFRSVTDGGRVVDDAEDGSTTSVGATTGVDRVGGGDVVDRVGGATAVDRIDGPTDDGRASGEGTDDRPTGEEPSGGDVGEDARDRERFRIRHGDGGWRTVEAVVAAGVGDRGDRLLVNVRDVTDRQRYEQRLRVLNRVLRHDLRNDANVVLGYADLLLKSDLDPGIRERAEAVRRKANRLVELGEQAREVDRTLHAEGGETHRIDLDDAIDSVAWRARETYPDAQIDTDRPESVGAQGNELVESALWHLVSNGIEHNDSEEPWVRLSVERGDDWVHVTVTDDGPGIPESERKVLAHGTETALEHGSGLGLWLVKWITDSVNGNVSFAERDPRGSVVTLELAAPVERPDHATNGDESDDTPDGESGGSGTPDGGDTADDPAE